MHKVFAFVKKNTVLTIAFLLAAVTSFIIPPDREYLSYFDYKTLVCLFCVLAVVCALRNINFFYILAQRVVKQLKNTRLAILALMYITFIGSMLIANDMALLTFLPLSYFVLSTTHKEKYMAFAFIMQNIAANLGGMLTPFGNPQNLYLYSAYSIPDTEFFSIMFPPFILSITVLTICCLFVKKEPLEITDEIKETSIPKTALYFVLFALSIAVVFRGVPYIIGLAVIVAVLLIADRKALAAVDYPLLLTFVMFFIFAGNMSRITVIHSMFSALLEKSTLVFSVLSCQLISNVPSAILLSRFTDNYPELLVGVNIGGIGTLISSLASLITFREYTKHNRGKSMSYIRMFSLFNFGILALLMAFMLLYYRFTR